MEQLPDSPWIRDAELNGMDDGDPVICPVCGRVCETIYVDKFNSACGCDRCMAVYDAWEWADEQKEGKDDD